MKKIVLLLVVLAAAAIAFYLYVDTDAPAISWDVEDQTSLNGPFTLNVTDDKGLSEVCVTLSGGACAEKVSCSREIGTPTFELQIDPKECAPNSKPFRLKVTVNVVDSSIVANKTSDAIEVTYDTKPPNLTTLKGTRYMRRGGTGVVLYKVNEVPNETGILLGDLLFRAFEFEPNKYLSFYAHPYYVEPDDFKPRVFADDAAGNEKKIRPGSRTSNHAYRTEVLELSDNFLESVKDKMMPSSDLSPLEAFVEINNRMRKENNQTIVELSRNTEAAKLWDGAFLRNQGATKARFADSRTYKYQAEVVDKQVHTGIDIAGINNTKIVAANHGKVVFTGDLGIYGNVVMLDHGYGIHSLYGHLNQVNVEEGDSVNKSDVIAVSGESGMAFGDHLHFEMRVNGVPVNPVEWFDEVWIANNIEPFLPGVAKEE